MVDWNQKLSAGKSYETFLAEYATPEQKRRWQQIHDAIHLTPQQLELLQSFTREMHLLVMAGAWCGDCVNQCPIFDHFARANSKITLRFTDRDADAELAGELSICGGARVPMLVVLSEEFFEVARHGDRTLSTYRRLGQEQLGATCPTGLVVPSPEQLNAVTQDWLDVLERAHLMLRLSARLRQKHQD